MKKIILFILLLPTLLWAQNYEKGELIVKLNHLENPNSWINLVETIDEIPTGIKIINSVSKPFDLYLISFEELNWTEKELIYSLKINNLVVECQVNHIIKNRAVPNDLLYPSQWQYNNTGQSGGLAGADIDIENAWEETTGGLTVDGDTIVVCVIDGGFQLSHPDLAPNMWKNYQEIPNNGIDDDSNGYVDDFRGWKPSNNSDNIVPNSGHGTPVAAIVGAKGGDSLGVAGVNWNVKIMGVSGGGNEAQALAAYTYPYVARKKYNETNGEEGAFVVATNASWGVDYGQAVDAPLWCAFYDSLGQVGILNAGATINGNVNVDVEGDLPTQCASDYLISVTNMNHFDEKVTGAGYGENSIDMGAFGQGTYTAENNNGYGGFGGTSGATPHVSGTIALLYSADCGSFIELSKQDPGAAALLIKEYIFDGLDANTSLVGITTQEGRLNVSSSMDLLLNDCASCSPAYNVNSSITDLSASITWEDSVITDKRIIYKIKDTNEWDTIFSVTSPYTLTDLSICSEYVLKVQSLCDDTSWASSLIYEFETEDCCYITGFVEQTTNETSTQVTWNETLGASGYTIYYKELGASNWIDSIMVDSTITTSTISDLESCMTYEMQIKSVCPKLSQFETIIISTKGCGACSENTYCTISQYNASFGHITRVRLNSFLKNSLGSPDGYSYYEGTSDFELNPGQINNIKVRVSTQNSDYGAKLWIDYNHDGIFDTDESIDGNKVGINFTFPVTIPSTAFTGITRMRLVYQYQPQSSSINACGSQSYFGEVEDYCVNIVEPVGLSEEETNVVSIYPNPVHDVLSLTNNSKNLYEIEVLSVLGKIELKETLSSYGQKYINVSSLQSGIYIIKIYNKDNKIVTKKFIKS